MKSVTNILHTMGEKINLWREPQPLGVTPDPESARLWEEFAASEQFSVENIYKLWKDPRITDLTFRQRAVTIMTAPEKDDLSLPYPHPPLGTAGSPGRIEKKQTSLH